MPGGPAGARADGAEPTATGPAPRGPVADRERRDTVTGLPAGPGAGEDVAPGVGLQVRSAGAGAGAGTGAGAGCGWSGAVADPAARSTGTRLPRSPTRPMARPGPGRPGAMVDHRATVTGRGSGTTGVGPAADADVSTERSTPGASASCSARCAATSRCTASRPAAGVGAGTGKSRGSRSDRTPGDRGAPRPGRRRGTGLAGVRSSVVTAPGVLDEAADSPAALDRWTARPSPAPAPASGAVADSPDDPP